MVHMNATKVYSSGSETAPSTLTTIYPEDPNGRHWGRLLLLLLLLLLRSRSRRMLLFHQNTTPEERDTRTDGPPAEGAGGFGVVVVVSQMKQSQGGECGIWLPQ